ncbi:MAG: endonuclease domain-containing protein [Flavobacteriales bacterium]|nr:endonuclease domain-containing protein [Flavobacteriales bacterium]
MNERGNDPGKAGKNCSPSPALPPYGGEGEALSGRGAAGAVHGLHTANVKIYARLKGYAKEMRQNPTPAERVLWRALRGDKTGVYFRRQHVLGNFIVDFVSLDRRLVVEVDGDIHDHQQAEDALRTQWLKQTSFHVLRFRNEEVLHHLDSVVLRIKQAIAAQPSLGAL